MKSNSFICYITICNCILWALRICGDVLNVDNHLLVNFSVANNVAKLLKVDFSILVLETKYLLETYCVIYTINPLLFSELLSTTILTQCKLKMLLLKSKAVKLKA